MNPEIEKLIDLALADGEITDKERAVIIKKAEKFGEDPDEVEMILDGRLHESKKLKTKEKVGNIKVCPSCGSPVKSFISKCQDCGHEFRDIESSNSVKKFFEMLDDLESTSKKEDTYANFFSEGGMFGGGKIGKQNRQLIKNFPIPNTKEDILEFLDLGVPRAKKKGNFFSSNFSDAAWEIKAHNLEVPIWQIKCEQIIVKARFLMKEDKKTLEEVEFYAKQLKIK